MGDLILANRASMATVWPPSPDQHPVAVFLRRFRKTTATTYRKRLVHVLRAAGENPHDLLHFPWPALRYQHVEAVRSELLDQGLSPASINICIAALKGVLKTAWKLGYLTSEDWLRIDSVEGVKAVRVPTGRALTVEEVRALFASCSQLTAGKRNAALLALVFGAGLRRSEAAAVTVENLDLEREIVIVRGGKGDKDRVVPMYPGSGLPLSAWMQVRGDRPGPVLLAVAEDGMITYGRPISGTTIANLLEGIAANALVARFTAHDARRTFITWGLDSGIGLDVMQALAGHANIATTAAYRRDTEKAKERAVKLCPLPVVAA